MRKTKIVCTMGPATKSRETLSRLIDAGMDIARLNFSHGTHEQHLTTIQSIRDVAREMKRTVAILLDLQGPKLRTGLISNGCVELKKGKRISITIDDVPGTKDLISTSYKYLAKDVRPGDMILLDDGLIQLQTLEVEDNIVHCRILEGGMLSDHKGINLPNVDISQPSLTSKDRKDLEFGIEHAVDFIALSFVRRAADVKDLKKILTSKNSDAMVIAKLEKPEAINDLDNILDETDGVMVARGDLGVEVPLEKVPSLQKQIIRKAMCRGVPVITATQMLESMRDHARPTRAEVSDVANAIFDGTDAVMLSAETAVGNYPIETVTMMRNIINEAEKEFSTSASDWDPNPDEADSISDAISKSACEAAEQLNAKAIVAFSKSGFTARMVSKYRPDTSLIAFTPSEVVQRQLNLSWGVNPLTMEFLNNTEDIVLRTEEILLSSKIVRKGDIVVVLMGAPIFVHGTTNLMKLHVVGEGAKRS